MPIQLMGAMLVQEAVTGADGRLVMTEPILPLYAPAEWRDNPGSVAPLPNMTAVLILWGGTVGDHRIACAVEYPNRHDDRLPVQPFHWLTNEPCTAIYPFHNASIAIDRAGMYRFKFLIDGYEVGVLNLPILWDDELPAG